MELLRGLKYSFLSPLLFFLSLLFVGLGQPSHNPFFGTVSAVCGYALFWASLYRAPFGFGNLNRLRLCQIDPLRQPSQFGNGLPHSEHEQSSFRFCFVSQSPNSQSQTARGIFPLKSRRWQMIYAAIWYGATQGIQLQWLLFNEAGGALLFLAYIGLVVWLAFQFALFSLLVLAKKNLMFLAALWTLIEWARLYLLCGFSWNPAGLALSSTIYGMQMASIWGVLGLSFWTMATNIFLLQSYSRWLGQKAANLTMRGISARCIAFFLLIFFPYFFGWMQLGRPSAPVLKKDLKKIEVCLVQTDLLPGQKMPLPGQMEQFISPWDQWKEILLFLKETKRESFDLIAFPEAFVPFPSDSTVYPVEGVIKIFKAYFGEAALKKRPPLTPPFASYSEGWMVSNVFWLQWISNLFRAEIVAGLDVYEVESRKNFNAAFHFIPVQNSEACHIFRYDKRILLPAEYLPFDWMRPLFRNYGIPEFFTPGKEAKIFSGICPFSISICYEETFADLIREGKIRGADFFVNVTNDNWYPYSSLHRQHFDHGRLRAVENGTALLRVCNSGITAAIDEYGQILHQFQKNRGALFFTFMPYQHATLYSFWGDGGVVGLCLFFVGFGLRRNAIK